MAETERWFKAALSRKDWDRLEDYRRRIEKRGGTNVTNTELVQALLGEAAA